VKGITAFFRVTFLWVLLLPYAFTFFGAASNQLVLIANGDKFPVLLNAKKISMMQAAEESEAAKLPFRYFSRVNDDGMIDDTHCLMTPKTHLNALADIFDFKDGIYSIGDLLLETGAWLGSFCIFVWLALVVAKLHARSA
jgi:Family of unknown function (DUF5317)